MNKVVAFLLGLIFAAPAMAQQVPNPVSKDEAVVRVATNAVLLTAPITKFPAGVWRDDYASGHGAPPLFFVPQAGACSLNAGNGDNGSQVRAADGNCWLARFSAEGADVRQWGAWPDAVPGAVGNACVGITGTDNSAAFSTAIAYGFANGVKIIAGGSGVYRLNTTLLITLNRAYWAEHNRWDPPLDFQTPIVSCSTAAAIRIYGEGPGFSLRVGRLIGPGAATSEPTPGGGAERIGIHLESGWVRVDVAEVMDFTYNILFDGAYGNTLNVGDSIASYKAIYTRNGAPGTRNAGFASGANYITYTNVGGVFTRFQDANFAQMQARSSYWGVHLTGDYCGNTIVGGAAQYAVKGTAAINMEVNCNDNSITTWLEGNQGADGLNLKVTGNNNQIHVTPVVTDSSSAVKNVLITGKLNQISGGIVLYPRNNTWGTVVIGPENTVNGDPSPGVFATVATCSTGAPVNLTGSMRYHRRGGFYFIQLLWSTSDIGTCTGSMRFTLPAANSFDHVSMLDCRNAVSNVVNQSYISVNTDILNILKYDGSFPAVAGDIGYCSGWFNTN